MTWKTIFKNEEVTEEPQNEGFNIKDITSQAQGKATGQYKAVVDEVISLASSARKDPSMQREALGKIRYKLKQAGIQEVQE